MKIKASREMLLSIVVPVYRSEDILPSLVRRINEEMLKEGLTDKFELLLVNDASPDNSWSVICLLARQYPFIKGISLRRNAGQHNATMAGLNNASGEIIVIMDDDLQHPPSAIGKMIGAILNGHDVCYTNYLNRQHALWKKVGSSFNDWVATHLLNKPKGVYLSSFKAMRREIVDEVIKYDGPYAYVDGLMLDVTDSITVIDIEHQSRLTGDGNYNLARSISLWLKMATSFSVLPLRLASFMGLFFAFLSLVLIGVVLTQKMLNPELAAGWTSLMATVVFIGGVQMFCIGVIGEYLGRAYLKLNGKPQFVVGATTQNEVSKEVNE